MERNGAKAGVEAETTWWVEVSSRCARYTYPLTVRGALPPLSALHASSSLLLLRSFLRIRALLPSHEESRCAHVPARRNTSSSSRFTLSLLRLSSRPSARFVAAGALFLLLSRLFVVGVFFDGCLRAALFQTRKIRPAPKINWRRVLREIPLSLLSFPFSILTIISTTPSLTPLSPPRFPTVDRSAGIEMIRQEGSRYLRRFLVFKTRLWNGRERSRVDDMYSIQGCSLIYDLSQKSWANFILIFRV